MFVFSSVVDPDPELFFPDPNPTSEKFRIRKLLSKTFQIKRLFAVLMFEG
jgi:hypothetical protein